MSGKKKKGVRLMLTKPDKYDITVAIDSTFEQAIKKIVTNANSKSATK